MGRTARDDGLSMPAEWEPHERTLIAWPEREATWRDTSIEAARAVHAEVVAAVAAFEPVTLVASPAEADDARSRVPADNVEVVALPIDDSWLRDNGPIVIADGSARAGVDFAFNAWGEAFTPYDRDAAVAALLLDHLGLPRRPVDLVLEGGSIAVDGGGRLVTTEQCLLNPNRNPDMTRAEIEARLAGDLGLTRVLWLGDGLANDHTDGHVDNLARFVGANRLALPVAAGEDDPNAAIFADAKARAEAMGVEVVSIPSPGRVTNEEGDVVPASYMNFYIGNAAVVVPVYGSANDDAAVAAIGALFPGRAAVGVRADHLLTGGGSLHCISQQIPSAG